MLKSPDCCCNNNMFELGYPFLSSTVSSPLSIQPDGKVSGIAKKLDGFMIKLTMAKLLQVCVQLVNYSLSVPPRPLKLKLLYQN